MSLGYNPNHNIYQLKVLKVGNLPFPILLGTDAPALVRAALPRLTAVISDDEEPGTSNSLSNLQHLDPYQWESGPDFRNAQDADPSLSRVRDDLALEDGTNLDAL